MERSTADGPFDDEFRDALRALAAKLRAAHDKAAKALATKVEQLNASPVDDEPPETPAEERLPRPQPAPTGHPRVLIQLKHLHGLAAMDEAATASAVGPDQFPLAEDSPLRDAHGLLSPFFEEAVAAARCDERVLRKCASGQRLLQLPPEETGSLLLAAAERHVHATLAPGGIAEPNIPWEVRYAAVNAVRELGKRPFQLPRAGMFDLLLYLATDTMRDRAEVEKLGDELVEQVEQLAAEAPLSEGERYVLLLFRAARITGPALGNSSAEVVQLTRLIGDGAHFCLAPGEVWSDQVNDDFSDMPAHERSGWGELFAHALTAVSSRPSKKWLQTAANVVEKLGPDEVLARLRRWLPLTARGRSIGRMGAYVGDVRGAADTMNEENATCLRGLLWLIQTLPRGGELVRDVAAVALTAYKKVPGVGPRAVKVGNAAVYALSQMPGADAVGQLAALKTRVKFGTAQKEIEKAFHAAAAALGLPRDEVEEMGVPTYGLEEVGRREETLGDYRAELVVAGADAQLRWFDAKGKGLKSVPAKVKSEHPEELQELK